MTPFRRIRGRIVIGTSILVIVTLGLLVYSIFTAPRLGADEGYEVIKPYLMQRGDRLYSPIWNDQPPVYSAILASVFEITGPSLPAARFVTFSFTLVALLVLWCSIRAIADSAAAGCGILVILFSPHFLTLAGSAMLEIPALSLSYTSAAVLMIPVIPVPRRQLYSGILCAVAIQTKLIALAVLPCILFLLLKHKTRSHWILAFIATISGILALFSEQLQPNLYQGHWDSGKAVLAMGLSGTDIIAAVTSSFLPLIGLIETIRGKPLVCIMVLVLIGSFVLLHLVHHPFWWYYLSDFAFPYAFLSAIGFSCVMEVLSFYSLPGSGRFRFFIMAACGGLLLFEGINLLNRAQVELRTITPSREAVANDGKMLTQMRGIVKRGEWVYTDNPLLAFLLECPIPPFIAVVPEKRLGARMLTSRDIQRVITMYKVPTLILFSNRFNEETTWPGFLDEYYECITNEFALVYRIRALK